jgi:hypothetical protein
MDTETASVYVLLIVLIRLPTSKRIINNFSDCLPVVAKWTVEATKALEMSERKQWPGNGLNFATSVLETLLTFGNRVISSLEVVIVEFVFTS